MDEDKGPYNKIKAQVLVTSAALICTVFVGEVGQKSFVGFALVSPGKCLQSVVVYMGLNHIGLAARCFLFLRKRQDCIFYWSEKALPAPNFF